MSSNVVVVLDAVPLKIIDAQKRVLAYPTSLCKYELALFAVGKTVHRLVYLETFYDIVLPLNSNLKKVPNGILFDVNFYLV